MKVAFTLVSSIIIIILMLGYRSVLCVFKYHQAQRHLEEGKLAEACELLTATLATNPADVCLKIHLLSMRAKAYVGRQL